MAARCLLTSKTIPGEAEELADLLADNRIAEMSEMDNKMLADIFADMQDIDSITLTGYDDSEIRNVFADFSEPSLEELDNADDIEDMVSVKITFDSYKEYARAEKEVKAFVEEIGARMVVTR